MVPTIIKHSLVSGLSVCSHWHCFCWVCWVRSLCAQSLIFLYCVSLIHNTPIQFIPWVHFFCCDFRITNYVWKSKSHREAIGVSECLQNADHRRHWQIGDRKTRGSTSSQAFSLCVYRSQLFFSIQFQSLAIYRNVCQSFSGSVFQLISTLKHFLLCLCSGFANRDTP